MLLVVLYIAESSFRTDLRDIAIWLLYYCTPVREGMITICTLPTVLTNFIHSIFKPGTNVITKNKVKIMDKNQNSYYNT